MLRMYTDVASTNIHVSMLFFFVTIKSSDVYRLENECKRYLDKCKIKF